MIRIVVADDHQLVREGIKRTIEREDDFELVGEAADMPSLLSVLAEKELDILLLDLGLCPPSELSVLQIVRERYPVVRVLIVSAHAETLFGIESLRMGASGYITKSMTVEVIGKAVRRAHAGGRYMSETLAELLAQELVAPKSPQVHELLTEREAQVMRLLATGLSVKQVAGKLDISISSVNTYRTRIFAKMQFATNAELIRYSIKHGLTS